MDRRETILQIDLEKFLESFYRILAEKAEIPDPDEVIEEHNHLGEILGKNLSKRVDRNLSGDEIDEYDEAMSRIDKLKKLHNSAKNQKSYSNAFPKLITNPSFEHIEFVKKLIEVSFQTDKEDYEEKLERTGLDQLHFTRDRIEKELELVDEYLDFIISGVDIIAFDILKLPITIARIKFIQYLFRIENDLSGREKFFKSDKKKIQPKHVIMILWELGFFEIDRIKKLGPGQRDQLIALLVNASGRTARKHYSSLILDPEKMFAGNEWLLDLIPQPIDP